MEQDEGAEIYHMPPYWLSPQVPEQLQELQTWMGLHPLNAITAMMYYGDKDKTE